MYSTKDERISLSKDVIEGMKSIKYLGWENIFSKKIQKIRAKEFRYIFGMRSLDGLLTIFFQSLTYLLLYSFIVSYVDDGNPLEKSNVFTITALFGYLTYPLGVLPFSYRCIIKAKISFQRIQNFLNIQEINQSDVINSNEEQDYVQNGTSNQIAVQMKSLTFKWPNKEVDIIEKSNVDSHKIVELNQEDNLQEIILNKEQENSSSSLLTSNIFELQIEDFKLQKGSLNFVVGKIGCGKTALLLSILNEMEKKAQTFECSVLQDVNQSEQQMKMTNLESKIVVNGSISYVSQNHWLQTKTIKDNIIFGLQYDETFYHKCLELCSLKIDLSYFYKGDQKVISSDGNNLSGGQRQRIALCRALYQDSDIYLLDDIFSSLDAHVAEYIFQHAILDYLIQYKKKTVLLVTSHYTFLQSNAHSNIIYLDHGSIVSDPQLIQQYIQTSQSEQQPVNTDLFDEDNNEIENNYEDKVDHHDHNKLNSHHQVVSNRLSLTKNLSEDQEKELKISKNPSKNIPFKDAKEELEEGEDEDNEEEYREKGQIKKETLLTYFKSMNLTMVTFQVIFFFMVEGVSLFIDFWLRDKLSNPNEEDSSFKFLNQLFDNFQKTFLLLTMIQLCMTILCCTLYVITSLLSCYRLYNKLNDVVMFSKMVFFDQNPVGRIINRLSDDVNSVDDDLPLYFEITLELSAQAIGIPIGMAMQFPWMSVFIILAFIGSYFVSNMFRETNREIKRLNSVNKGKLLSHISESCKGLVTIRSMGKQLYMNKQYLERLSNSVNTFILTSSIQMWMFVRLLVLANGVQLAVAVTAIILVVSEADFNSNVIVLCLSYSILFIGSICDVVNFICMTEQEIISVERLRQYFDNQVENLNQVKTLNISDSHQVSLSQSECNDNYSIIFKNLYITYDNQNDADLPQSTCQFALSNFDLKIKRGEKIAFCGRTGSGKTSVLNCLYRLYEYQKGGIFLNNQDIQQMSLMELRSKMAIIPQFGFLYNASLRDNIDPLEQKTDEEILALISSTQTQEIEDSNKNGDECFRDLQFEIQEGGKNLSNGQKQIINFIRVALRNSEIICLDEATSNMDPKTDKLIHDKLFQLSEGKTLLVITHRLENIEKFDRIVVLDGGKIVECGNINQLRQIEGGFFNRLIKHKQ